MPQFANPYLLLLIIPVLALLWDRARRSGRQACSLGFSDIELVKAARLAEPTTNSWLPWTLMALAMVVLIMGLARPRWPMGLRTVSSEGVDIVLCIDTSPSMENFDVSPNRMEAAKRVSEEFVSHRQGDRLGVVVFGGIALTQCPLTTDYAAVLAYLDTLKVGMTRTDQTAIGDGLLTATARLRNVQAKDKVIILLTDGRSNAGEVDPVMASKIAAEAGIRIYTVGVGAKRQGDLELDSVTGEELDEGSLQEVAAITKGQFFRATDRRSLQEIYQKIDSLEKRAVTRESMEYGELYVWFIGLGCLLAGAALVLEHTLFMEVP